MSFKAVAPRTLQYQILVLRFARGAFVAKPVAQPAKLTISCLNGATAIVDLNDVTMIGCVGGGTSNVQFDGSGCSGGVTFDVVSPDGSINMDSGSYRTKDGNFRPDLRNHANSGHVDRHRYRRR